MPIKKRNIATEKPIEQPANDGKLVIVAKSKKPIPNKSVVRTLFGTDKPTKGAALQLGLLAQQVGAATADEDLTIEDRVALMRTPYDDKNPQERRYRNRVKNRGTAITAMCITCQGGRKAVTECIATTCPLWAFRFGSDPFYGKRGK